MKFNIRVVLLLLIILGVSIYVESSKQTAPRVQQDYKIVKEPKVIGVAQQKKIDADAALAQEVLSQASKCLSEGSPGYRTIRGCPAYYKVISMAGKRTNVNWDLLSTCETGGESATKYDSEPTGGNWFDRTGEYPGGMGMSKAAWRIDNIWDFPRNAGDATRLEQIAVSENTYFRVNRHGHGWAPGTAGILEGTQTSC